MKPLMFIILYACGTPNSTGTDAPIDASDAAEEITSPTEIDDDEDDEDDASSTVPTETAPSEPDNRVRFVALGDGGEGNADQYQVADVLETVCAERGCDFALYLGDNIYDTGVDGVDDPQFLEKFEAPYANLDFPFYVVLGNHDYGGQGAGWEFWVGNYEVQYTAYSEKWVMPDHYYAFETSDALFIGLDTNLLFYGLGQEQGPWVDSLLEQTDKTWRIAYGHHTYRSNGQHGNAGTYEGIFEWVPLTEIPRGALFGEFFDDHLCDQIDLYLCGHDHNRQWLAPHCGVELMVSGAAAKTTGLEFRDGNVSFYDDDTSEGFVWIELHENQLTAAFYDKHGTLNYEGGLTK